MALEVIGGIAAVLSLIKATKAIKHAASNLRQNIQDAPFELEELITQVELFESQLQQLSDFENRNPTIRLTPTARSFINTCLNSINEKITGLEKKYAKYKQRGAVRRRIGLVLLDRKAIQEQSIRLHKLESMFFQPLFILIL
jgi:hypothetical protein